MTPASGLVSLEFGESRGLVARLREAGASIPWALPWGSLASYEGILAGAAPFVLLDEPMPDREARLIEYTRVLGLLIPVVVCAPPKVDAAAVFAAGALDVLDRTQPAEQVRARLSARARGLPTRSKRMAALATDNAVPVRGGAGAHSRGQRVLVSLLAQIRSSICCHDLGLLLGPAGHPLSSPAVRARMRRLSPALFRFGVVLSVESHWDRVVYRIAGPA
jgi:hypothetical protein